MKKGFVKKGFVNQGALRDGVRLAAAAGPWESANDLFKFVLEQPRCKDVSFWDFLRQYRKEEPELQSLRDEALATKGCGKQGYVPPEVNCPGRHGAKPFIAWDDGFCCSLCDGIIPQGSQCLGCRLCDHDVCTGCIRRLWPKFEIAVELGEPAEAGASGAAVTRRRQGRGKAVAKAGASAKPPEVAAAKDELQGDIQVEPLQQATPPPEAALEGGQLPQAEEGSEEAQAAKAEEADASLGAEAQLREELPDLPQAVLPKASEVGAPAPPTDAGLEVQSAEAAGGD